MKSIHSKETDQLFQAILTLKNSEECYALFEDLCTVKELESMAQRLETAIQLKAGKSYQAIYEEAGVSTATISRVSRCLNYGQGGYQMVIERLAEMTEVIG